MYLKGIINRTVEYIVHLWVIKTEIYNSECTTRYCNNLHWVHSKWKDWKSK